MATTTRLGAITRAAAVSPERATPLQAIQRVRPPPSERCPKTGWVNDDDA